MKNNITRGVWYLFSNNADRIFWLESVYDELQELHDDFDSVGDLIDLHKDRVMLKVDEHYDTIRFRTNFRPDLESFNAQMYVRPTPPVPLTALGTDISSTYPESIMRRIETKNTKEGTKMSKQLIETARKSVIQALRNEYYAELNKLKLADKTTAKAIKALNELRIEGNDDHNYFIDNIIKRVADNTPLTEATNKAIAELDEQAKVEVSKANAKFAELEALYDITETYDQKVELLNRFGILKHNTVVNLPK